MEELYPNLVKVFEIGRTYEGRIIKVLRISDDPQTFDKIWIDGGIHGREWMTPSAITYIIYTMLLNWDVMPYHVKTMTWFFLPVLNPDGYDYSWKTDRLWYRNRRKNLLYAKDAELCRGKMFELYNTTYSVQQANLPFPVSGTPIDWAKILLSPLYTYQVELRSRKNQGFLMAKHEILPVVKEALDIVITFSELIYENDDERILFFKWIQWVTLHTGYILLASVGVEGNEIADILA
ncbi:uncharacterized protein LOC129616808 [Condylostylus longicornis]|uniref:uncharacterized protein LOC129616808 n=1 Tax=Condylostylus longicornis TaxID=2530218 RepID=UPI00244DFC92|nr:uncharacterized protein LOC129616808 [Condylostylus longicornis]